MSEMELSKAVDGMLAVATEQTIVSEETLEPAICNLSDNTLNNVSLKLKNIENFCDLVKMEALRRAREGTKFFGFRLQKGRTMRTFSDEKKVAEILGKNGIAPYTKRLRGVADIEKVCPHYSIMAELEPYIVTETKSPTLVAVKAKAEA